MTCRDMLRDALDEQGLMQKDAARMLGITPAYMSNMLNGRCRIGLRTARALSVIGIDGRKLWLRQAQEQWENGK